MNMALGGGKMNIFGVPYPKIEKSNLRSLLSSFPKMRRILKSAIEWYFNRRRSEVWVWNFQAQG